MDTIIKPPSFKDKLIKHWQVILKYSLATFIIIWILSTFSGHSVDKSLLRIATVTRGDLIIEVEGSGTVKASGLKSFYSPVDSYIKDVFKREGHLVQQGDTILTIDSSELDKAILEIENRIRITQNELKTKEIEFQVLQVNNKKNEEIFKTNKEKHTHELNVSKKLNKIGAISEGDVLVKEADLKKDLIDLKYLKQTQMLQQQKLKQEIETLKLTIQISQNELAFQKKLRGQTTLVADENGAISNQPYLGGEKLQKGQRIAQVTNMKNFVVEVQISQRSLEEVVVGQPAKIRINGKDYSGKLTLLQPDIKDGYGLGEVSFSKDQNIQLKQNQRAQVFIQTGFKKNTLLVERGAFVSAGGRFAFKVNDDIATKQPINVGGRNYDVIEIVSGLNAGDQIVVSQITSYIDWDEFKIK